jgi:hypothetical protein
LRCARYIGSRMGAQDHPQGLGGAAVPRADASVRDDHVLPVAGPGVLGVGYEGRTWTSWWRTW